MPKPKGRPKKTKIKAEEDSDSGGEAEQGAKDGRLERSDRKSYVLYIHVTNHLLLVASLLAQPYSRFASLISGEQQHSRPGSYVSKSSIAAGVRSKPLFWTKEEDDRLREAVKECNESNWKVRVSERARSKEGCIS